MSKLDKRPLQRSLVLSPANQINTKSNPDDSVCKFGEFDAGNAVAHPDTLVLVDLWGTSRDSGVWKVLVDYWETSKEEQYGSTPIQSYSVSSNAQIPATY